MVLQSLALALFRWAACLPRGQEHKVSLSQDGFLASESKVHQSCGALMCTLLPSPTRESSQHSTCTSMVLAERLAPAHDNLP